jgi:hypothetical protein
MAPRREQEDALLQKPKSALYNMVLVHSLIMTLFQVPLVGYDVLQAYSIYTNNNVMLGLIMKNFRWLQDLLMFGNSILLFILRYKFVATLSSIKIFSTTVRQGYLAFYGINCYKKGDRVVSLTTTKSR